MKKIEYLIITKESGTFCNTKESFLSFLQVDSSIEIIGDNLCFKCSESSEIAKAKFSIQATEIASQKERCFHLILSLEEGSEKDFKKMTDIIKKASFRINPGLTRIDTLWDDLGRQCAIQAYPLINEIENLMRKLISKFMLINVGMDWSKEAIHSEILEKISRNQDKQNSYSDILHQTDFIHLSDVLFKKYRTLDLSDLDRILLSEPLSIETFESIKKVLPKSNWERHFSKIIQYDEEKLKEKWKALYSLRNDVAHNRYIDESDYFKAKRLVNDLKKVLVKTIDELDKIDLTEEDKENIVAAYQPVSTIAKHELIEQAVADWYRATYPSSVVREISGEIPFIDIFMTSSDESKIAIEVKIGSFKLMKTMILRSRRNLQDRIMGSKSMLLIDGSRISELHIVYVVRDFAVLDIENRHKILRNISDIRSQISESKFRVIIGYLDENDSFAELEAA
jgi:hypothetical protein